MCAGHAWGVEVYRLAEGDLGWVFPGPLDEVRMLGALRDCDEVLFRLADHFGLASARARGGLKFFMMSPPELVAFVEPPGDVSFRVCLESMGLPAETADRPRWEVSAHIEVRCGGPGDCGMHPIEQWGEHSYDEPLDAARALVEAAEWLLARGTAEPLPHWESFRGHD